MVMRIVTDMFSADLCDNVDKRRLSVWLQIEFD